MLPKTKLLTLFLSALFVGYGLVGGILSRVSAGDDTYRDLSIFTAVLNKVKQDYVERPDLQKAMLGALHGMMEALDPHSSFIDYETYQGLERSRREMTASPGIVLSKRHGYAYVVSTVPGSPADVEGLRSGDLIESIDGRVTTQMSLWEARKLLIGAEDSILDIKAIRGRRNEPSGMSLSRKNVSLPEVSARIVDDEVGFLKIPHFEEGVEKAVSSKLKMLKSLGMRGLLIDVRGAALGDLEGALQVSDFFLPKGARILVVKDRSGNETEYLSLKETIVSDIPVFVLIDGGTSGPAEVFVAALRDHAIAEMVGERTNGEGSIQEIFHLEDGSVLQISMKLFYRANGEAIQALRLKDSGIVPDLRSPSQDFVTNFYFENTADDLDASLGDEFYRKLNNAIRSEQLEEGVEQIRKQLVKKAA
jgi:carboxyl-terminal processing protease